MSQQINLFNPQFLSQKKYFSVTTMLQGLALILLGSAVFYGYAAYQVQQLKAQAEEVNRRYVEAQGKLARITMDFSPEQARRKLEEELQKTEMQLQLQRELIATLKSGAIGNTKGYSEYMRAFSRQTIYGLWLTGFDITGDAVQINMHGATLNPELVPGYINRLGREKIMRGKNFAALKMQQHKTEKGKSEGRPYLEFTLQSAETSGGQK